MNTKAKRMISFMTVICILAAFLTGCGSEEVAQATQKESQAVQENPQEMSQQRPEEMPEMQSVEISEEDIAELVQAGLDAVAEESALWSITEIADTEVLMQLMQFEGGNGRPEGEAFEGDPPENMTPQDGEPGERPDGEMPEGTRQQWDGENPPENREGSFPEGEKPENGQAPGGDRQPGNRGGGIPALAIVIANGSGTAVAAEDVLAGIEAAVDGLGYQAMSMEVTEDQIARLEIPEGFTANRIILIGAQMSEMERREVVD